MKYLQPKARNTVTNQTVKTQNLTGLRYDLKQRKMAEFAAEQLADKMTAKTRVQWEPLVVEYTPRQRKS